MTDDLHNRTAVTRYNLEPNKAGFISAAYRMGLEAGAGKIEDMLYLLSIGTPGEGPFTRQDRTRDEVVQQAAAAIRALPDKTPAEIQNQSTEIAALLARLEAVEKEVYVAGQWACPKCKFTLQQMHVNAQDGTITANNKPAEPCPNCETPLWRTTWKQEAVEMMARAEEQALRAREAEAAQEGEG